MSLCLAAPPMGTGGGRKALVGRSWWPLGALGGGRNPLCFSKLGTTTSSWAKSTAFAARGIPSLPGEIIVGRTTASISSVAFWFPFIIFLMTVTLASRTRGSERKRSQSWCGVPLNTMRSFCALYCICCWLQAHQHREWIWFLYIRMLYICSTTNIEWTCIVLVLVPLWIAR